MYHVDVVSNYPLHFFIYFQDILNELPPTSPPEAASTPSAGGLSPSQAGPDRSHGANSTLHKLLLTKRTDPVRITFIFHVINLISLSYLYFLELGWDGEPTVARAFARAEQEQDAGEAQELSLRIQPAPLAAA